MSSDRDIPLSAPEIGEAEIEAVVKVLRSGQLSCGPSVEVFERGLAQRAGVGHAVTVNSGTSGLHLCVRALGLGEGDEVITTPFSFIASANVICYERARPVFVDIRPDTLNIDAEQIESKVTSRTRAVLSVHTFSYPAPMKTIRAIADRHRLSVIEDAAEALGGTLAGQPLGSLGDLGVYAFYPNKQITTGEGGAVVTADAELARRVRMLRNQGRDPDANRYDELGYSYRLPDILCALGTVQLGRLDAFLERRAGVARAYTERLDGSELVSLPPAAPPGDEMSWFVYVVRLSERFTEADRDAVAAQMLARGVGVGRYFPPIHLQPYYRETFGFRRGDFPVTERVAGQTLALPFHNSLGETEIDRVCETLTELLRQI